MFFALLAAWRRRRNAARDIDAEIRSHLELETEQRRSSGLPQDEASHAARRAFGNVTLSQEAARAVWIPGSLDRLIQDLRYSFRMMRRSPGFTVVAVLSLALGIGAAAAVFSVTDRILFRSLPYPHAARIVSVGITAPVLPYDFLFGAQYLDAREEHAELFEALTSWSGVGDCDLAVHTPVRLTCALVESTFLSTLGVQPVAGRSFLREEDGPKAPKVAIVSHALWQSQFAGRGDAIGSIATLDGLPTRVVGVLPAGFETPTLARADVLIPQGLDDAMLRRATSGRPLRVLARLAPGVTTLQAQAFFAAHSLISADSVPAHVRAETRLRVRTLRELHFGDAYLAARILLASVFAVLLIACANIGNLLLARGVSRRRELAMRAALGASRRRLIRQALTESLLLGALGGTAGLLFAHWMIRVFAGLSPAGIPGLREAPLDPRVVIFAVACSLASAVLFGSAPALSNPQPEMLTGWRTASLDRGRLRQTLVVVQIALSLLLVTTATLLTRTLRNLQAASLGMHTENVLTASLVLPGSQYTEPQQRLAMFEQIESRLRNIAGVTASAVSDSLPPSIPARSRPFGVLEVEGRPRLPGGGGPSGTVVWRAVSPGYFAALGIPIVKGRAFREQDRRSGAPAIILSQSLARRLFPGEEPIGERVRTGPSSTVGFTVIGVARDVRNSGSVRRDDPEYYVARSHSAGDAIYQFPDPLRRAGIVVRSPLRAEVLAAAVRAEIAALDRTLAVTVESMSERVRQITARPRFNAALLGLFAAIGLVIAAIGLYGVVSFLVVQRTQEIGVRMALGATRGAVSRMILLRAARWVILGALFGLAASLAASRVLGSMLFGLSGADPATLTACAGILVTVTCVAAWLPSRRAAAVDPVVALRHD